jgi:hypothetical protein
MVLWLLSWQTEIKNGGTYDHAGTRLYVADLVYAIRKENIEYRLTNNELRSVKDK